MTLLSSPEHTVLFRFVLFHSVEWSGNSCQICVSAISTKWWFSSKPPCFHYIKLKWYWPQLYCPWNRIIVQSNKAVYETADTFWIKSHYTNKFFPPSLSILTIDNTKLDLALQVTRCLVKDRIHISNNFPGQIG